MCILLTYLFCPSTVLPVAMACFSPFKSTPPNYLSHFLQSHAEDTQWPIMTPQTASIRHSAIDSSLSLSHSPPLLPSSLFLFIRLPSSHFVSLSLRGRPPLRHTPNAGCSKPRCIIVTYCFMEMAHPSFLCSRSI